jgi:starvation-inducible DNA-binding protein
LYSVIGEYPRSLAIDQSEDNMVSAPTKSDSTRRFYPTRLDLTAHVRSQVAGLLNQTLAATLDLKTQTKQAHWNVKGMDFYQLHEMFDEMAGELEEYIDMVAERVTALGGTAMGTARLAAANSILPEYDLEAIEGAEHVRALADRFAPYAKHVREAIDQTDHLGDADTADLYTEISRKIDQRLWFLEAHLVKKADLG